MEGLCAYVACHLPSLLFSLGSQISLIGSETEMIDFITQNFDQIFFICFFVVGLVVPILMGCDEYPYNEPKIWKIRLIVLPIIGGCVFFIFRNTVGVFGRIFISLGLWLVFMFPRGYVEYMLYRNKGDNEKK